MHIRQLNVSHDPRQDRLLLRLNTATAEEFRFWVTRRLSLRLLPALEQTSSRLESSGHWIMAPDPQSRQILNELKRDEFLNKADFQTPYAEEHQHLPLGEEPMLVTDVHFQQQGPGLLLTLQDKGGATATARSCHMQLEASLLHGLIHLLRQAMDRAEWHMPLQTGAPVDEQVPTPVGPYAH